MRLRAVIFDWRGTLVLTPTFRGWVAEALRRIGRDPGQAAEVIASLDLASLDAPGVDADAARHRETYYAGFRAAGLDGDLADSLYAVESDPAFNPFAVDVGPTLRELRGAGVRIGVLSDIHFDIRPAFGDLPVDSFVLSFEHGVVKPDPAIFRIALDELGTAPGETLMVGDRSTHDGAGVEAGLPTLLVPPLRHVDDARLHLVTNLVG
ncbi:HAD superfamily hydrolase (TIGR01549 family) [Saccharothrix carnea]|uniref:HAD superfamily hydrolase (TIGR01549 family) n=1 Tax=Saccharothrix carnea TaxID=1280637 RepID=A0A2P8HG86_SACCR|nr:HAD-IA family hydrolase [Saccharothrix carnea]PSL45238.1 HAD superfamily hydrolase (TIGR01549 family) [Saccharothrix carnea]